MDRLGSTSAGAAARRAVGWVDAWVDAWRRGSRRSQLVLLGVLLGLVTASFVVSLVQYSAFPIAGFFVWLLLGRLLLRFSSLVTLSATIAVAASIARFAEETPGAWPAEVALLICCSLVVYAASRHRGSLPGPLSEDLLADLRARLNARGQVTGLPDDWSMQSSMLSAWGVGYAGDFMVADHDPETGRLDLVLVDVVGKGVTAAPAALLFAGALGGLVGSLHGPALLESANAFLLRQNSDETFATAVHVTVSLRDGSYEIRSAGHPPALRWDVAAGDWLVDNARGLALGVLPHPDLECSKGVLAPGEALMFYTDGVIERPGVDIDDGITWLRETARDVVRRQGLDGAARRVVAQVTRGDDDRALLILSRR